MSDIPPWGIGPPWPAVPTKLYNLRFSHKTKPGRYYYLDRNLSLTRELKNTKAMSYTAGRIALDHALALAGLLANDSAPDVIAELVEVDSNP